VAGVPVDPLAALEEAIGWTFSGRARLEAAMVHRSYCAEHPAAVPNERLEFLGDAVLGLAVTDHVYATYPDLPEGELAKLRASVVNAEVLAELARVVGIGPALVLGKGEAGSGGREKPSILADAMEAIIAAVYLDGGWEAARDLVLRLLGDRIEAGAAGPGGGDFKTRLQEYAAREFEQLPRYQVRAEGPDHSKHFFAMVTIRGAVYGHGQGRSKKQAEQAAAQAAWTALTRDAGAA
jgi:ribonuclease-3